MFALATVDFGSGLSANAIATGYYHSCVILNTNAITCWGDNSYGQLGYGDMLDRGTTPASTSTTVNLGPSRTANAITVGVNHTCVILNNRTVKCWGFNESGQLGYGDTKNRGAVAGDMAALVTVNIGSGRTAKAIAAGANHTCVILNDNTVKCWGDNSYGQLGYDDTVNRGAIAGSMTTLATVNLGIGRTAKAIVAGYNHTCAILDDNKVKCWGANSYGQLGNDSTTNRGATGGSMAALATVIIGSGRTALTLDAGENHTCAVLDDNTLKCWGANGSGQLGYADIANRGAAAGSMAALTIVNVGSGRTVKSVSAGFLHTCAMLDTYELKCWGENTYGQLGYDDDTNRGGVASDMAALASINLSNAAPATKTLTPSQTSTSTKTQTLTKTSTSTKTQTLTKTSTSTKTQTLTKTSTLTKTQTRTKTSTLTKTPTRTQTKTRTQTQTRTP